MALQTVGPTAKELNTSEERVYALAREGVFPRGVVVRLGRQIRFDPEKLREFINQGGAALPGGWRREPQDCGGKK